MRVEKLEFKNSLYGFTIYLDLTNLTNMGYNPYNTKERNTAILTNGFTKKTQKTPVREIEKANLYRADYFAQNSRKE